jgi:CHAD domain-containing protein
MAFAFARTDRSVPSAVRRIAAGELESALAALARPDAGDARAVHGLRKRIKKLRGLLRLVQPRFDGFATENAALRDAGRLISALRDAEVRVATFARLAPAVEPRARAAMVEALAAARAEAAAADGAAALAALREALAGVRARVPDWDFEGRGFAVLAPGLERTWKRAQHAMAAAAAERAGDFRAEPFHDWRKRVKAHWYQARLLAPIWPEMMAPHIRAVDDLGEALGKHNDIAVLVDWLAAHPVARAHPGGMAALASAARDVRAGIADACLIEGRRFLAGSARALSRRWGVWWEVWRDQAARPASAMSISAIVSDTP